MKDGGPDIELNIVIPCKALDKAPQVTQMRGEERAVLEQGHAALVMSFATPVSLQVWVLWLWHVARRAGSGWGWSAQHHGWPGRERGGESRAGAVPGSPWHGLGGTSAPGALDFGALWTWSQTKKHLYTEMQGTMGGTDDSSMEQSWGMSFATPVSLEQQDLFLWSLSLITGWGWGPQPDGLTLFHVQTGLIQTQFAWVRYIIVPLVCCLFITKPWYCHNSCTENRAFHFIVFYRKLSLTAFCILSWCIK